MCNRRRTPLSLKLSSQFYNRSTTNRLLRFNRTQIVYLHVVAYLSFVRAVDDQIVKAVLSIFFESAVHRISKTIKAFFCKIKDS